MEISEKPARDIPAESFAIAPRALKRSVKFCLRTVHNVVRYGPFAPKPGDLLMVDPGQIKFRCRANISIGHITSDEYNWQEERIEELPVFREVRQRIVEAKSWEEIGSYQRIMALIEKNGCQDGCRSEADVLERYRRIDDLIHRLQMGGRILANREMGRLIGQDDIKVHIDPNGGVVKACGGGMHRFSIARVLGITSVPALVCSVHEQAVLSGAYRRLRWEARLLG